MYKRAYNVFIETDRFFCMYGKGDEKMLTLLFTILLISFVFKLIGLAIRATWGIMKIILMIIFFPLFLIAVACTGAIFLALILLVIGGLVSMVGVAIA